MNTDRLVHWTMYQQPAQQAGAQTAFPSQQPAAGTPQGYGPPPQPIMYQMPPGQPQPVLTGQPPMGQQGQPLQYYVPAGQPTVQSGYIQGAPAQPPVDQEEEVTSIKIDIKYLKSGLNFSRIMEFVSTAVNCKGDYSWWVASYKNKNTKKCTSPERFLWLQSVDYYKYIYHLHFKPGAEGSLRGCSVCHPLQPLHSSPIKNYSHYSNQRYKWIYAISYMNCKRKWM